MAPPRRYADAAAKQRAYRARQAHARRAEQAAKGLPPTAPLPTLPSWARWRALIAQAQGLLQTAMEEMSGYGDDRSEAWQESARAEELREQIAALEQIPGGRGRAPPLTAGTAVVVPWWLLRPQTSVARGRQRAVPSPCAQRPPAARAEGASGRCGTSRFHVRRRRTPSPAITLQDAGPSALHPSRCCPVGSGEVAHFSRLKVVLVSRFLTPLDELARLSPRRFGLEQGYTFDKGDVLWTAPHRRTPEQMERWTDVVSAVHHEIGLARELVQAQRLPGEAPTRPLTPRRARRGRGRLSRQGGTPAGTPAAPARGQSPGRPHGAVIAPTPRHPVIRTGSSRRSKRRRAPYHALVQRRCPSVLPRHVPIGGFCLPTCSLNFSQSRSEFYKDYGRFRYHHPGS